MLYINSVQFNCSVLSDSLWPHEEQHARPPCPSSPPRVHPNPCPLNWWCQPTISSSVVPFSSWPQSFPASGSFQMHQLFASGGQSIGVSASTSVLPMNTQDWLPLGWTGWISLQRVSQRDSQESFPMSPFKSINSSVLSFLYSPTFISIHDYWKNHNVIHTWNNFNNSTDIISHWEKHLLTRWCWGNFKQDPSHAIYDNKLDGLKPSCER